MPSIFLSQAQASDILVYLGAILKGHFIYKSGLHGDTYVNKDSVYPFVSVVSNICQEIAAQFTTDKPQVVIGPAMGGIILSQWTAYHLNKLLAGSGLEVLSVYADKEGDDFVIKRGFDKFLVGKKVLVVEDVLTTGGSARKVVAAVKQVGGEVIGVGCLCNRGQVTAVTLGAPRVFSLVEIELSTWQPDECPMCQKGMPINQEIGHGGKKK